MKGRQRGNGYCCCCLTTTVLLSSVLGCCLLLSSTVTAAIPKVNHQCQHPKLMIHRSPFRVVTTSSNDDDDDDDDATLWRLLLTTRGGGDVEMEDADEYDLEDEDEEEVEVEEKVVKLSQSTVSAVKKSKQKATTKSKAAVNASLKRERRPSSKSIGEVLHIPYIVRACLNPFTVLAMTKAYFASLFNINYLQEQDSSQGLRSALQAKAKKEASSPTTTRKKGKRTMKPGQAKTLSDLPALSA